MAAHKTKIKTVYLIFCEGNIVQAASTLPKLVGAGLYGKSYYYFYRKLNGCDYAAHLYEGNSYQIKRLKYD